MKTTKRRRSIRQFVKDLSVSRMFRRRGISVRQEAPESMERTVNDIITESREAYNRLLRLQEAREIAQERATWWPTPSHLQDVEDAKRAESRASDSAESLWSELTQRQTGEAVAA